MKNDVSFQLNTINQEIRELFSVYRKAIRSSGISGNKFWIWYALLNSDGCYVQSDLCSQWSMSKQTVNSIAANMVKNRYAVLETVPGTRNRKLIRLSEMGKNYGNRISFL